MRRAAPRAASRLAGADQRGWLPVGGLAEQGPLSGLTRDANQSPDDVA
jgi:hypothetical protein